jgi:Tfp pilus assembly protein PilF
MRTRIHVAVLLLAGVAFASPALAQTSKHSDAATEMARQRFEEGVKLFDRGDFPGAQAAFLQAWALKQHPAVLLNLAQSELRSGDHVAAARHFAQYLQDYSDTPPKERATAQQGLEEARKHTGRLDIVADAGADVFVDGESVGRVPLPGLLDVKPGTHVVEVRSAGSPPVSQETRLEAGETRTVRFEADVSDSAPLPAPPPAAPEPDADSGRMPFPAWVASDPVAWATLGVTGLGVGAGTVFAIMANSKKNDADNVAGQITAVASRDPGMRNYDGLDRRNNPCASPVPVTPQTDYRPACSTLREDLDALDKRRTLAWVGFGLGVAGAVGTGVAYYLRSETSDKDAPATTDVVVAPLWSPELTGIGLGGTF